MARLNLKRKVTSMVEDLSEKVRRLQILLSLYGDRTLMENATEWQKEIEDALAVGECAHSNPELSKYLSEQVILESLDSRRPVVPFDRFKEWIDKVVSKEWFWVRNTRCKYVVVGFDTRRGAYSIKDRSGDEISLDRLMWQYSKETPEPPE